MTTTTAPEADDPKGFAQIPRWLQRSSVVTGTAKLVYLALSSRADKYGRSHPAHKLLAAEASCSVASVKRALDELQLLGVVSWEERRRGEFGRTSNVYTIGIAAKTEANEQAIAHRELHPVDNRGGIAHPELGVSSHRATNEREPVNELNQSSRQPHLDGASAKSDDDNVIPANFPKPAPVSKIRVLDVAKVQRNTHQVFAGTDLTTDQLRSICIGILAKSPTEVLDETAYVCTAIRRESHVYQQLAFDLAADQVILRLEAGGNDF